MNKELEKIIDFAIDQEHKAVKFYQDLQKENKFSEKKNLLKDLENMEKGHIEILNSLKNDEIENIEIKKVQDLHISDYLIPVELSEDMSYQDIIVIAIKKEEKAYKLYNDLASKTDTEDARKLFLKLASEEAKHKNIFEQIYDEEVLSNN